MTAPALLRVASPGCPVVSSPSLLANDDRARDTLATCPCGRPCTGAVCSECENQIVQGSGDVLTTGLGSDPTPAEIPTGEEG